MRQIIGKRGPSLTSNKVNLDTSSLVTMDRNTLQRLFKKPKRFRSAFTTDQTNYLEQQFKKFPYVNTEQRKALAAYLHIEERSVKIWFQNRRMKEKKESNKECNDETTGNTPQISKNQFNNAPAVPSTNGQCSYSLPILLSTTDTVTEANIDEKKANYVENKEQTLAKSEQSPKHNEPKASQIKANYYKEATKEDCFSPYFNRQPANNLSSPLVIDKKKQKITSQEHNSNTSAEFSINLYKKYEQASVGYNNNKNTAINENIAHQSQSTKNLEPKPTSQTNKDKTSHCRYPEKSDNKKPKMSYPPPPKQPEQFNLSNRAYYPVVPTMYGPPFVTPGSVLWKPVNFMPVMATSAPIVIVPNSQGPQANEQSKCCKCDCNGNTQQTPAAVELNLSSSLQNPYPQYVIALPYQHTSPKF